MNYEQTIDYLYSQLPVFHRIGAKAFKADLSNTIALCQHLGNPENTFKSIHVAGTNGKGSSSHFLAAILQSAGYKTGLYTSPHLKDFVERFRINGKTIDKAKVIDFVQQNKEFIETLKPSFFEMSVALAFDFFAHEKVDIAVIEVGLGGRLDSTNIITPEVSLITNIGYDHTDILGDTLPKIATEKAGIIKSNVPVVISEKHPETDEVFIEKAKSMHAPIYFAQDFFKVNFQKFVDFKMIVDVQNADNLFRPSANQVVMKDLVSELGGKYQLKNLRGVLKTVDILKNFGYKISEENIRKGIAEVNSLTGLKGRWQILKPSEPLIICDTGHNEHGLRELLQQINSLNVNVHQKHFVLGFVKDKDVKSVLALFPKDAIYYFCQANSPRSLPAEDLLFVAKSLGLNGYAILNVNDAIQKAQEKAQKDDFIFVGGSNFVVGEIENL